MSEPLPSLDSLRCFVEAARLRNVRAAARAVGVTAVRSASASGRLVELLPEVVPASDFFRLVFRGDDPRRGVYERLAEVMLGEPLR